MIVTDYQFQYRDVLFGANTYFGVEKVEGIDTFAIRRDDSDLPRGHGSIPGKHYVTENDIVFSISVDRNNFDDVELALQEFKDTFKVRENYSPDSDHLYLRLPGSGDRMIKCRPVGVPVERSAVPGAHIIKLNAVFTANDPRIYSANEESIIIQPYNYGTSGIDFDLNLPLNFASGSQGLEGIVNNNGNAEAWPLIRIHGPDQGNFSRMTLWNVTNNSQMIISTPVLVNQILSLDMESVVTANGKLPVTVDGDNRYGAWKLPRDPFFLSPGPNEIRLAVEGESTGVSGVITWRHTSL